MSDNSSSNRRIAKNTIFLTIRMVIVLCVNLFSTRIVLESLGVEDFGIYSVVGGLVTMFTFLNTSMSNGIQRFFNYELGKNGQKGAQKVYITSLQIQLLLGLVIILLTETVGLWYLNTQMVIPENRFVAAHCLFQFSIVSFLISIMQVPYIAAIVAHEEMDFYALVSIVDVILKMIVAYSIVYISGDNLIVYGFLIMSVILIDMILYYIYAHRKFVEIRLRWYFDKELFKSMLGFSIWNVFGSFASMMKEQGVNMVINVFFGPIVNAARGVSYQIMGGLNGFSANVSMTTRPQIVKSYAQGDINRTVWLFFLSSKLCFMAIFLFALPIIMEIHFVLQLWLGDNVPMFTEIFTLWVLLTAFVSNLNGPTSGVVHATGNMKNYQLVTSIVSLSIVPLTYCAYKNGASPEVGFIIVFVVTAICQILSLAILRTLVNFSIISYIKEVALSLLCIVILSYFVAMIPHVLMEEGFTRLVIVTFVSIVAELLFFVIFGMNKVERKGASEYLFSRIKVINQNKGI